MSIDLSSRHILIVDDQLLVRSLICQILRTIGMRPDAISQASDGNTALRVLQIRAFDLILCDFQMAPINGMDLLKAVRCACTPNPSNVPFVFLSGHPERALIMQAGKFHADGFIIKPPTPGDIEKNIQTALARPRPAIDPFHYLTIPTGSAHDQATFERQSVPPQSIDLDTLLERFRSDTALNDVMPDSVLAHDLLAADGRRLLQRGVRISRLQLTILKQCQAQYGIDTIAVAHLPQDQLIMYQETYGL